jgi:hypothetical protein
MNNESNSTSNEQQRILKRIEQKIRFVKQCCKGKEADYRYYELANLRDSILDDIECQVTQNKEGVKED